MFTKITNWMDKPFTNGTYVALFLITGGIAMLIYAGWILVLFWDKVRQKFDSIVDKVKDFFTVRVKIHRD